MGKTLLHYETHQTPNEPKQSWIVFLHGAGGSIHTWKHQIADLKPHFNLLTIDLRDHGDSKQMAPSYKAYSFDVIVDDILKVIDHQQITTAHFVSLSFGSVLLQALYAARPALVSKMIVVGGIFNANWMIKSFVHMARFFNLFLSYPSMYRVFSYLLMPKKRHQVARKVYQRQARKLTQKEYLKWLGLYSDFFQMLRSFHQQYIGQPMLVLMGDDDYLFLPSARKFALNKPNVSLQLIPKAGHICNIEKPALVNQAILAYLKTPENQAQIPTTTAPYGTSLL